MKRLDLVVGSDDAGKSTFIELTLAAGTRTKLIELGESFIAETVFSHPSKLELLDAADAAGYTVSCTPC